MMARAAEKTMAVVVVVVIVRDLFERLACGFVCALTFCKHIMYVWSYETNLIKQVNRSVSSLGFR